MKGGVGRRGFMALMGFGAAAGPAAAKMVAPRLASGSINLGGAIGGMTAGKGYWPPDVAPTPPWTMRGIGEMAWKALRQKADELEQRRNARWNNRIDGLDPDLWALRSMSLPARLAVQAKRDRDLNDEINEANEGLFGKPEQPW